LLEVEPIGQRGGVVLRLPEVAETEIGNEAVAGAVSEAFDRWFDRRYSPVQVPPVAAYRFTAQ